MGLSCPRCPSALPARASGREQGTRAAHCLGRAVPTDSAASSCGHSALAPQRSRSQPLPSFPSLSPPLPGDTLLSGPSHAVTQAFPASRPPHGAQRGPCLLLTAPLGPPPGRLASAPATPAAPAPPEAGALGPQSAWPRPPPVAPRPPPGLLPRPRARSAVRTRLRRRPGAGPTGPGRGPGRPRSSRSQAPAGCVFSVLRAAAAAPAARRPRRPPDSDAWPVSAPPGADDQQLRAWQPRRLLPGVDECPEARRAEGPPGEGKAPPGSPDGAGGPRGPGPPPEHPTRCANTGALRSARCEWAGRAPRLGVGVAAAVTSSR